MKTKTETTSKVKASVRFPSNVLQPLLNYLRGEEKRLVKVKVSLKKEDPFKGRKREADNSVDADVAEQVDHDRVLAVRHEIIRSLINIRKTLTRVKIGRYGTCERCGQMIDTDRLAVKPTAEFCVICEQAVEAKR